MTTFRKIAAGIAALTLVGVAAPAFAGSYRIEANSTKTIDIQACRAFNLSAEGDGDTDLDFRLISPTGKTVHEDDDLTDLTWANGVDEGCGTYRFYVENLGEVYNQMELRLTYTN